MIRSAAPERRYAILAEGRFANSSAKTAHGLIRYGKDEVVCVMDSTLAGERVADVLSDLGRDAPIVGTPEEALELSPTSVLVGQIGRASCRERVESWGGGGERKTKADTRPPPGSAGP